MQKRLFPANRGHCLQPATQSRARPHHLFQEPAEVDERCGALGGQQHEGVHVGLVEHDSGQNREERGNMVGHHFQASHLHGAAAVILCQTGR